MSAVPSPPLLRRPHPAVWLALPWCAFVIYAAAQSPTGRTWQATLAMGVVIAASAAALPRLPLVSVPVLLAGSLVITVAVGNWQVTLLQLAVADIAVYLIAAQRSWRLSVIAAGLTLGAAAGCWLTGRPVRFPHGASTEAAVGLTIVVAWLIGNSVRQGRVHAESLRAQAVARAVTAERLRIAREVHDLVAHSIGIIAIQAGMGSRVIESQPAEARGALQAIEGVSRDTLAGLRRMLGALRQAQPGLAVPEPGAVHPVGPHPVGPHPVGPHPAGPYPAGQHSDRRDPAALDPAPGLADVCRLAATARQAGLRVDVRWQGERDPLPADIDLSAFRIIQEAVTNVVRHAHASQCQVSISQQHGQLSIEVVDDGSGGSPAEAGYGITGMRERAALLHGDLLAGPVPGGGFRVAARLPMPAATR